MSVGGRACIALNRLAVFVRLLYRKLISFNLCWVFIHLYTIQPTTTAVSCSLHRRRGITVNWGGCDWEACVGKWVCGPADRVGEEEATSCAARSSLAAAMSFACASPGAMSTFRNKQSFLLSMLKELLADTCAGRPLARRLRARRQRFASEAVGFGSRSCVADDDVAAPGLSSQWAPARRATKRRFGGNSVGAATSERQ